MDIHAAASRAADLSSAQRLTYDSANRVGSHPADAAIRSRRAAGDVDPARSVALAALRNERFGSALAQISDPRASDALMLMGRNAEPMATALGTVLSGYLENG